MKPLRVVILLLLCAYHSKAQPASSPTPMDKMADFPTRFLDKLHKKTNQLEDKVLTYSEKTLKRLEKQERKLYRKLYRKDSLAAKQLLASGQLGYAQLQQGLQKGNTSLLKGKTYFSQFDTLHTSLKFLSQYANKVTDKPLTLSSKLPGTMEGMDVLNDQLQQAKAIQDYVKNRRQLLRDQLQRVGLVKELKQYNKLAYYYAAQIKEYRTILEHPEKLIQKAIDILRQLPLFNQFMQQHSEFAALFPPPNNGALININGAQLIPGLQARAQVQQQIQNTVAAGGPNAQAMLQQNINAAQGQLSQLKDKLIPNNWRQGEELREGFKKNSMKTKNFWKRLEYGTNIQTARSSYFYPQTSDIGLSLGYMLNENSVVGVGSSFKLGTGKSIRAIRLTAEGLSLRSFADMKLKGSFYISGAFEYNYQQPFTNLTIVNNLNSWTSSALIGISKIVSVKTKYLKKTKLQLFWDPLSYKQKPPTQAVKFRVGYDF